MQARHHLPEIYEMQVARIIEAALRGEKGEDRRGARDHDPMVGHVNELAELRKMTVEVADEIISELRRQVAVMVGTMIELPRAR
jgi:pyruvate,orthophosphate dikinase